jgi:hypothetical protein
MIILQTMMNPFGVIIGWIMSSKGDVIKGVCFAISAGNL